MSMISAFVRYFFLTKLFLCLLILFLLMTMSVPEIHITGELALLSRLIVVVFCFIIFLTFCFIF